MYRIMYQYSGSNMIHNNYSEFPNIRALAKFLNSFVGKNPKCRVLMCHVSNSQFETKEPVQFMPQEFEKQKWFTGYKERLLEWYKVYHIDNPKKGKKKAKTKKKSDKKTKELYARVGTMKIRVDPMLTIAQIQENVATIYPQVRGSVPRIQGNEIIFVKV